jgi:hypothetical protein
MMVGHVVALHHLNGFVQMRVKRLPLRRNALDADLLQRLLQLLVDQFNPATETAASPNELAVTRVSLYKYGVGFFEHAGRVTGDQAVTIDFTTAQLNDVLQSLTAVDLNGGRISEIL